jgi:hypothetical protein
MVLSDHITVVNRLGASLSSGRQITIGPMAVA